MVYGKNILIIGPPGSGKTYFTKKIVVNNYKVSMADENKVAEETFESYQSVNNLFKKIKKENTSYVSLIYLHEGYSYENLIEGVSISTDGSDIKYQNDEKLIVSFINNFQKSSNKFGYLILDDISRVNIVNVLGETLYALANRGACVTLRSGNKLRVPENLYFIATVNSADMLNTVDYGFYEIFDQIIHIDNSKEAYENVLEDIIKEKHDVVNNKDKYLEVKKGLIDLYDKYTNDYCVFNKEFLEYISDFKIGYTYFLPYHKAKADTWIETVQHKIRHQVLPLLWQYEREGIIKKECIPIEEKTDTAYVDVRNDKMEIEFIDDEEYLTYEKEVFEEGKPLPIGRLSKRNTSHKVNWQYVLLSGILRDIVNHSLINHHDLMDILENDKEIAWFRNDVKLDGKQGAKLLVKESNAKHFPTRDATDGNSGSYSYSDSYHKIKYDSNMYKIFSAFQANTTIKCPYDIGKCKAKGTSPQKQHLYPIIKMLVYKYLLKYKANLKKIIEDGQANDIYIDRLKQLEHDIEMIKNVTDDKKQLGNNNYVNLEGQNGINMVAYIRNLATWKMMLNEGEGVYKTMSREYQKIMDITNVHQMILQGPPGTSKTYGAKKFLCEQLSITLDNWEKELDKYQLITSDTDEYCATTENEKLYWDIIQFHPSYTYEDFVRGISVKPDKNKNIVGKIGDPDKKKYDISLNAPGGIIYKSVNKAMGKIAKIANEYYGKYKAEGKKSECPKFYLVIDEINRANLATVFGELIYALEYRDESVKTPYSVDGKDDIIIPPNLYILGTMNTADKSIGTIDYAIRRRFLFFKMLPNINTVIASVTSKTKGVDPYDAVEVRMFYLIEKLFDVALNSYDYEKEDVQIGHTYFLRKVSDEGNAKEQMKYRMLYQIAAILYEYKKDGVIELDQIEYNADEWLKKPLVQLKALIEENDSQYNEIYEKLFDLLYEDDFTKNMKEDLHSDKSGGTDSDE